MIAARRRTDCTRCIAGAWLLALAAVLADAAAACTRPARTTPGTTPHLAPPPGLDFVTPLSALAVDDVAFVAEISAHEVRFDVVPTNIVTFSVTMGGRTVYTAVRDNIPKPVLPGVTYRAVRARVVIATSLPAIEQVLAALDAAPLPPAKPRPPDLASFPPSRSIEAARRARTGSQRQPERAARPETR